MLFQRRRQNAQEEHSKGEVTLVSFKGVFLCFWLTFLQNGAGNTCSGNIFMFFSFFDGWTKNGRRHSGESEGGWVSGVRSELTRRMTVILTTILSTETVHTRVHGPARVQISPWGCVLHERITWHQKTMGRDRAGG